MCLLFNIAFSYNNIIQYKLLYDLPCHLNYSVTYTYIQYTRYKNIKLHMLDTELTTTNSILRF
jgi:hypothetical protein